MAQVYAAPLSGGGRAVVLLNRHYLSLHPSGAHNMTVHWKSIGIPAADMVRKSVLPRMALCDVAGAQVLCMPEGALWPGCAHQVG